MSEKIFFRVCLCAAGFRVPWNENFQERVIDEFTHPEVRQDGETEIW